MIFVGSARDQQKVVEAISDPEGYEAHLGLLIEGSQGFESIDLSRFPAGEWGQEEIPITLDATILDLPARFQGGRVRLFSEIEGVVVPQVPGEKTMLMEAGDAYSTDLISSSPGAYLNADDAIKFGEFQQYPGDSPEAVVWDIARRVPYDGSMVDIEPIPGIYLQYTGVSGDSPGFKAQDKTGDGFARVKKDVGYDYRDTVHRGLVAEIPKPLGRLSGGERTYPARRMPDWQQNRPKPTHQTRYRDVRVYAEDGDGNLLYEAIEEVPYREGSYSRLPYEGQTLDIDIKDTSAEGYDNAKRRAVREALDLARTPYAGETMLPTYDPLTERSDRFRVAETRRDGAELWDLLWVLRIEGYRHLYGGSGEVATIGTRARYSAAILEEEKIDVPALIVPAQRSAGVVQTPAPVVLGLTWASTTTDFSSTTVTFADA